MSEFLQTVADSISRGACVRVVLSDPRPETEPPLRKVTARPVVLKSGPRIQLALTEDRRETHRNLPVEAALSELGRLFPSTFRQARLFETGGDVTASLAAEGTVRVSRSTAGSPAAAPALEHNRRKPYLIPEGTPCPFLAAIGVMTPDGRVRSKHHDKFRQINRFLEFVEDVYPALPETGRLRVVDFGCGRSSLTFALHHLLTAVHGRDADITGLDLKADVIEHCRAVAAGLNCAGLRFEQGDIAGFVPDGPVDLSVSLHACDTATDAALAQAIRWQARVILAVPCCHHEFAQAMTRDLLPPLQQHGILRERFAELATDAARATLLEAHGYRTQVLEFIDLEQTHRNLLIRAVRRPGDAARDVAARTARDRFEQFRGTLGLPAIALERLLDGGSNSGSESV